MMLAELKLVEAASEGRDRRKRMRRHEKAIQ